ncbi:18755_t:CDS:2, partial [Entrophospora sp. SA101]
FNYISGEKSNNIFGSIEKSHGEPLNIKNQTRNTLVMAMNEKEERMNLQSQSNSDTIKSNGNLERQIALLEKRIELNLKKSKLILKIKRDETSAIVEINLNSLDESSDGCDNIIDNPDDIINIDNTSSSLGKRVRKDEEHDGTKKIIIDFSNHPLLETYSKLLFNLQNHHVEEDSQRARHLSIMLEWSVVNYELFNEAGWIERTMVLKGISTRISTTIRKFNNASLVDNSQTL